MTKRNLSTIPNKAVAQNPESEELFEGADEVWGLDTEESPAALGFTLDEVMQVLRQKRLTLLAGALVGLALVAAVLNWTTPLYAVSAKVVVSRQAPGDLVDTDSGSSVFIATQAEVMSSLSVIAAAVATLPRPGHLEPLEDAVKYALDAVHASAISGTRVIAFSYLGADAVYGAALLRAMVDAYGDELRTTNRSGQAQALNTKAAELEVLLENIAEQEARIKESRGINNIIGTADEAAAAQSDRLQGQTVELREVRSRRIGLESRLVTGGAGLNVDDPGRHSLQEDLRLAEAELARVSLSLTAEHPTVLAAERNVKVLRAQLAASVKASPVALRQQIAEAARHEAELTALEAQSRGRLEAIESHRREENELLAELARTRFLADSWRHELFDQRLVARLARAGNVGVSARIIAEPLAPEGPVWPRPKLMLPAGLMFGVTGGFVFGLASLRRRRREDFTRVSNP